MERQTRPKMREDFHDRAAKFRPMIKAITKGTMNSERWTMSGRQKKY